MAANGKEVILPDNLGDLTPRQMVDYVFQQEWKKRAKALGEATAAHIPTGGVAATLPTDGEIAASIPTVSQMQGIGKKLQTKGLLDEAQQQQMQAVIERVDDPKLKEKLVSDRNIHITPDDMDAIVDAARMRSPSGGRGR